MIELEGKGPQRCICGRFMKKGPSGIVRGWRCSLEISVERGWLWEHP